MCVCVGVCVHVGVCACVCVRVCVCAFLIQYTYYIGAFNMSLICVCTPPTHTLGGGGPAYCLETAGQLLFSGGEEGIQAWKWSDLTKTTNKVPLSSISPAIIRVLSL